ncbi:hypothetical protein MW887_009810 [Aspergillus wentii]|nr:hypothetical protein MW887_009810 [Aspergillus wentii]
MSTLENVDSVANPNQGEFKPARQGTGPLRTDGHQPGRKTAPADYVPEFHAQTLPPGTAPASNSYTPNPIYDTGSQALNPNVERAHGKESVKTSASDTLGGTTSKDVHQGFGNPGSGQTKNEIYHDGQHHRKHERAGLEGVGSYRQDKFERTLPEQRGLEREEARGGQHGNKGVSAAEDIPPQPAETVAAGR